MNWTLYLAGMKPTVGEHLQQDGVLASGLGHLYPELRLAFGEVKDLRAIAEHRRSGEARIEMARVDFADVGDERGLDAARLDEEVAKAGENLVVGEPFERIRESDMRRMLGASADTMGPAPNER